MWTWYVNGRKKEERTYKVGKQVGKRTIYWYKTGKKYSEGTYKYGKVVGLWTEWYENGQKAWEGTYKNGKEDGLWTFWYVNGKKESEGTYKYGKEDGLWTEWYKNGRKKEERTYKVGVEDGLWTTYWYKTGKKHSEETYKNGKVDGIETYWYKNGQKEYEIDYKDLDPVGLCNAWYENGQKREVSTYKDGSPDGLWTEWYENGQKERESTFKDGVEDGLWTTWYENGQKSSEENWNNGIKESINEAKPPNDDEKPPLHQVITGQVTGMTDKEVLIDIGFKSEGIIDRSEFPDDNLPKIGENIELFLERLDDTDGASILAKEKADFMRHWQDLREIFENQTTFSGKIVRRIKGGMIVDLEGIQGFLPGSQIDVRLIKDFDQFLDQDMEFKIIKFNDSRKNIVVSHKVVMEEEIKKQANAQLEQPGEDIFKGETDIYEADISDTPFDENDSIEI